MQTAVVDSTSAELAGLSCYNLNFVECLSAADPRPKPGAADDGQWQTGFQRRDRLLRQHPQLHLAGVTYKQLLSTILCSLRLMRGMVGAWQLSGPF